MAPKSGRLFLDSVSGNRAIGSNGGSGGISNDRGTVTLTNSTVSDNYSATGSLRGSGGGIGNYSGTATLTNSTVSGNRAATGGGIYNGGILNLTGVTLAFNNASFVGGVQNEGGTANLNNTIIARNSASSGASAPDFTGAIAPASSFNLVGSGKSTTGITNGTNGNQVGTAATLIDPKLNPTLALNGGATLNHALLSDSPAIDKGSHPELNSSVRKLSSRSHRTKRSLKINERNKSERIEE